jgi:SWI/SNF-related matrix-associated actin-dependent regulator 1 of chromatin subfamily A
MKLTHNAETQRFELASTYEERAVPKAARFRWDPKLKQWWTDDPKKAAELIEYADEATRERLTEAAAEVAIEKAEKAAAVEASRATDAEINVPAPDGLEYLPFQRGAIAYAMDRPGTLLADEMGLGKTIEALGIINADPTIKRILVVCPASLKANWKNEAEAWLVRPTKIAIAKAGTALWPGPVADLVIVNYDLLHRFHDQIREETWDCLIVDEAHFCKNQKARRTKQVIGATHWDRSKKETVVDLEPIPARRKIFLTGTPITNRPIEAWPLVYALAPETFENFFQFARRYCDAQQGGYGWDFSGASNLVELQEMLRGSCMIRRLKAEVLKELPPKRRQVIELPSDGCLQVVRRERQAFEALEERLGDLRATVELAKASENVEEYRAAVAALTQGYSAAFAEISQLRHATALAKVPQVIEWCENALETNGKIIIFCHHKDVVAEIEKALAAANPVVITGDIPVDDRQPLADAFQNDPKVRAIIGTIGAMGVGFTLTASTLVVFAELDWVPANLTQAEDRAHRIGQAGHVLVQHLVLEASLDSVMAKRIVAKQQVIDAALDEIAEKGPSLLTLAKEQAATETASREKLEKEAPSFTPMQIEAVHGGLRILAGLCDGAVTLDGMGFSKIDTQIGRSLAECLKLTPRQAALGQRLCRKYHRQLPEELLAAAGSLPKTKG